jgi:predicted adenylyl cyclase CyaB
MARNIEIKASLPDRAATLALAKALADGPAVRIDQDDTFFDAARGRLKLRCMADGAELIAYRRPDQGGPKLSEYWRSPVSDADALREVLTQALGPLGRVQKVRWLLMVGRTRIHIDEVGGLGDFLELEVVLRDDEPLAAGQAEAERLLAALKVSPQQLQTGAYLDLLRGVATVAP